jgi:7-carboxy-7-deazaguanine synthase
MPTLRLWHSVAVNFSRYSSSESLSSSTQTAPIATIDPASNSDTPIAKLVELFSAIQGEGANCGTRQIFVRFAFCDLRCHYCDSAHTWTAPDTCTIEATPGQRDFQIHPNPVTLAHLLDWIDRQNHPRLHNSISITGGEPLLHATFLKTFLPQVKQRTGLPLYLETGGHRPELLDGLLDHLDQIGMDVKLPSSSGEERWTAHAAFLRRCVEAKNIKNNGDLASVFVKTIVSAATTDDEIAQLGAMIRAIDPKIATFLQPVTPLDDGLRDRNQTIRPNPYQHQLAPTPQQILDWQAQLKQTLDDVRVIPQTHKMLGQL